MATKAEFRWWWCRMSPPHAKMLSDKQPICPECKTPMLEGGTMTEQSKEEMNAPSR